MAATPAVISAHHLGKCYHIYETANHRLQAALMPWKKGLFSEFWALRDVCFEVQRGEALGILGRNGSGKSTLLQLIAGILRPTEGEIVKQGRISALLELGSGFNPEFTGRENVFLNGSVLGINARQMGAIFDEIVSFADIGPFIDQPVKNYSSGMMVRLAFAVAVAVQPDILIVDEALAVGDIAFQRKCFRRIEELRQNGLTLLWVTHDPGMTRQICNRAIVLERGRMLGIGDSAEMSDLYLQVMFGGSATGATAAGSVPRTAAPGAQAEDPLAFASVPEALRYEAAAHQAGAYDPADAGAYNQMVPVRLAPGRYHLELRLACQAQTPKAVEIMVGDWQTGRVALGAYPTLSSDTLAMQTLEYDFEVAEELAAAEVRITNLRDATIQLASLRLWMADPADATVLHPVCGRTFAQMSYFNGREARPFPAVPVTSGALAKVLAQESVVIERAALLGADGRPRAFFHVDDEVQVVAEALVLQPLDAFQFGFLVRDKLGQDIFGESCSNLQLSLAGPFAAGARLRFRANFRASLRQGTYFLSLGMTDYTFTQTHYYGMDLLQLPLREKVKPIFGVVNLPHHFAGELIEPAGGATGEADG